MGPNHHEPNAQSVDELEAALAAKTAEYEAMRQGGARGVLTHVFFVLLCGGGLMMFFVSMLVGLISMFDVTFTISPMTTNIVGLVLFIVSLLVSQQFVFVPKKGVDELEQITVGSDRIKLERALSAARELQARRDEELATKQRATHGGGLSLSTSSESGRLSTHRTEDAGALSQAERVVLDLDGEEREVEQVHVDEVVDAL